MSFEYVQVCILHDFTFSHYFNGKTYMWHNNDWAIELLLFKKMKRIIKNETIDDFLIHVRYTTHVTVIDLLCWNTIFPLSVIIMHVCGFVSVSVVTQLPNVLILKAISSANVLKLRNLTVDLVVCLKIMKSQMVARCRHAISLARCVRARREWLRVKRLRVIVRHGDEAADVIYAAHNVIRANHANIKN